MHSLKSLVRNENTRLSITVTLIILVGVAVAAVVYTFRMAATTPKAVDDLAYTTHSRFRYVAHLIPNNVFDTNAIDSDTNEALFKNLLERIDITYSYQLEIGDDDVVVDDKPLEYEIISILKPDQSPVPRKTTLIPRTAANGQFTVNLSFSFDQILSELTSWQKQTGITTDDAAFIVEVKVYPHVVTPYGVIETEFSHPLTFSIKNTTVEVSGLEKSMASSLNHIEEITNPQVVLYRSLAVIILILTIVLLPSWLGYVRMVKGQPITDDDYLADIRQKYGDIVVEAIRLPPPRVDQTIVPLRSVDDLARAAEGLMKPIVVVRESGGYLLTVLDNMDGVRYEVRDRPGLGAALEAEQVKSEAGAKTEKTASMSINLGQ